MENKNSSVDKSLKLLAKTSIIVFIGLIISKIFLYLYRITIARYLGPEVYGLFSLTFMISQWFMAVFSFGLLEGLFRYIAFYRGKNEIDKAAYIYKKSSKILLVSSLIAGVFLFALSDFISIKIFNDANLIIFLRMFSLLIPVWVFSNIFVNIIRAFEKINIYSFFVNILQNVVKVLAIIILIIIGFKTDSVIYSFILGILVTLIFPYIYCRIKLPAIFQKYNLEKEEKARVTKDLVSYSWPIMFLGIITIIFYWVDSFIIGYFKGVTEVGFYNSAVPIALLLGLAPELFMQLFFPMVTKEYSRKKIDIIKELSKQTGKWIFIINLPAFILIMLFPGAIINLLFGPEYLVAENALRYLAISSFFSSIFIISNNLISVIGKSKIILVDMMVTLIINTIFCIFLVPIYGMDGAAISTMMSMIALNLLFFFQARHYTSIIPLRRKMIGIAIIGVIAAVMLFIIKQFVKINLLTLVLLCTFFVLTYFLLIFVTGMLDKNDLMIIRAIKKKIIG